MAVKKSNKRIMITFRGSDLVTLTIIMDRLQTKQVSKAVRYLIDFYLSYSFFDFTIKGKQRNG